MRKLLSLFFLVKVLLVMTVCMSISFAYFSILYSQNTSNVLIGILEDDRTELANWKKGPSKNRVIRPLFEKKGGEWKISTFHPNEIQWTIAFDGRNFGSVKSRPNTKSSLLNTDTHIPMPQNGQALTIGKPSKDFSGWQSTLFNRPLVVVSKGNSKDPDEWKPFQPTKDQIRMFISTFRTEYSKVLNCNEKEEPLPDPWPYKDSDINISKAYHSNKEDLLVGMFLKGGKCGINEGPFQQQFFLFKSDKSAIHLTLQSKKRQSHEADKDDLWSLFLVDAGDYDGDGKSEVVFFLSGYNEDGYVMFYDSFQKSVMSTWSYH